MNRRTHIVAKPGQRQLLGSRASADRLMRFENEDRESRARERDRGSESIRSGADNNGVVLHGVTLYN